MQVPKHWLALFALSALACSRQETLHPVEGQVVYKDKGIQGVLVTFHPKGANAVTAVRPIGFTKDDGSFTLTTGDKAGAAPGEYIVTFVWPKEVKEKKQVALDWGPPDAPDFFAGALADPSKSEFKVEIKSGPNKLEPFHLK